MAATNFLPYPHQVSCGACFWWFPSKATAMFISLTARMRWNCMSSWTQAGVMACLKLSASVNLCMIEIQEKFFPIQSTFNNTFKVTDTFCSLREGKKRTLDYSLVFQNEQSQPPSSQAALVAFLKFGTRQIFVCFNGGGGGDGRGELLLKEHLLSCYLWFSNSEVKQSCVVLLIYPF